jgi:hypothetical protein
MKGKEEWRKGHAEEGTVVVGLDGVMNQQPNPSSFLSLWYCNVIVKCLFVLKRNFPILFSLKNIIIQFSSVLLSVFDFWTKLTQFFC